MKYLKKFTEAIVHPDLDQSVIDECKDICLELEDIGFKTNIRSYFNNDGQSANRIGFSKYGRPKSWIIFYFSRIDKFTYSDIEDVVERLKSYLSNYDLYINWVDRTEKENSIPNIETERYRNPANFQYEGLITTCELNFVGS